jgi:hypothetical protein
LCWFEELNRLYSDLSTLKFLAVKFMVDKTNEPVDLTLLVKADKEEEHVDADVAFEDVANYTMQHKCNAHPEHWLHKLESGSNLHVQVIDTVSYPASTLKGSCFVGGDESAYGQLASSETMCRMQAVVSKKEANLVVGGEHPIIWGNDISGSADEKLHKNIADALVFEFA